MDNSKKTLTMQEIIDFNISLVEPISNITEMLCLIFNQEIKLRKKFDILSADALVNILPGKVIDIESNLAGSVTGEHKYVIDAEFLNPIGERQKGFFDSTEHYTNLIGLERMFKSFESTLLKTFHNCYSDEIFITQSSPSIKDKNQINVNSDGNYLVITYSVEMNERVEGIKEMQFFEIFKIALIYDLNMLIQESSTPLAHKEKVIHLSELKNYKNRISNETINEIATKYVEQKVQPKYQKKIYPRFNGTWGNFIHIICVSKKREDEAFSMFDNSESYPDDFKIDMFTGQLSPGSPLDDL